MLEVEALRSVDIDEADRSFLQTHVRREYESGPRPIRFADLFCGCGGMSLGVLEAARALGRGARVELAIDNDVDALAVYHETFAVDRSRASLVDLSVSLAGRSRPKTKSEALLLAGINDTLDLAIAGPPCQGHSDLNNHTRRDDEKNDLYPRIARFVELTRPRYVLVENVAAVVHDVRRAVERTVSWLRRLGYATDEGLVPLNDLGVPQLRRRHVLVAAAPGERPVLVEDVVRRHAVPSPQHRTVAWAIRDLLPREGRTELDRASQPTPDNRERIKWLHARPRRHDLPNELRPRCHRGAHSYKSMYGKLWWDRPAQTITSGYGSMGQGRYVHPLRPRTLTPHEAARLQFFPDFFRFDRARTKTALGTMIGNAAPMKLSYAFALAMFG